MWNELLMGLIDYIPELLFFVITSLLGIAFAKWSNKVKNEEVRGWLDTIGKEAKSVVMELQESTVDALKEASADGKLTEEEIKTIKSEAWNKLATRVPEKAKALLKAHGYDMAKLLLEKIQGAVKEMKIEAGQ